MLKEGEKWWSECLPFGFKLHISSSSARFTLSDACNPTASGQPYTPWDGSLTSPGRYYKNLCDIATVFCFSCWALCWETYWPSVWLDFNSRFKHALGSGPYLLKISAGFNFVLLLHVALKVTGQRRGIVMVFVKCQSRLLLLPPASLCAIFLVVKLSTSYAACLASLCLCAFSCFSCIYMETHHLLLAQYCGIQQGFKYSTWLLWQT